MEVENPELGQFTDEGSFSSDGGSSSDGEDSSDEVLVYETELEDNSKSRSGGNSFYSKKK